MKRRGWIAAILLLTATWLVGQLTKTWRFHQFSLMGIDSRSTHGEFEVVLYSYLNRPIFDVMLNGTDIGVAGAWQGNFAGGGSMSGVDVKFGPQLVSWRLDGPKQMPRNGETVRAKNAPNFNQPPRDHKYLCVHIFPDDTVEVESSNHFPDKSERGGAMAEAARNKPGT